MTRTPRPTTWRRRTAALSATGLLALAACGGGDDGDDGAGPGSTTGSVPAAAESVPPSVEVAATDAPPSPDVTDAAASFAGASFVDVIDAALEPYVAALGTSLDSPEVAAAVPGASGDVAVPAVATVSGVGRSAQQWDTTTVLEEHMLASDLRVSAADLEGFGSPAPAGWTQRSFATSGSMATLLLTADADGRRAAYTVDADAPASAQPAWELVVEPLTGVLPAPVWLASLPALAGGVLVEVVEGSGHLSAWGVPTSGSVSARWRYPADQLEALEEYLASGVVEAAGFTFDRDTFNGFAAMVDVTAGAWVGTVVIGEAMVDDQVYVDLVWSLSRP